MPNLLLREVAHGTGPIKHKLTVFFSADVAGCGRRMGENEAAADDTLEL